MCSVCIRRRFPRSVPTRGCTPRSCGPSTAASTTCTSRTRSPAMGSPRRRRRRWSASPGSTRIDVDLGREHFARPTNRFHDEVRDAGAAVRSFVRLARHVRRHNIRIIYTSDRPRDAMASVVLARLTRARSVVHLHVVYSSWMGRGLRWAIRSADPRIAVSQFVADSVTSGGITGPTHVALNAIDPEGWVPGEGRTEARSELGLPESAKVVITVCRLFEEKGVARLIRALAASRGSVDDARLLIVGHDPAGGRRTSTTCATSSTTAALATQSCSSDADLMSPG